MKTQIFAISALGQPIFSYHFGSNGPKVLILGGVHGDESEGVALAHGLLASFLESYPYKLQIILVPQFNVDGVFNKTRMNGHGVDLNRNLPTKDWQKDFSNPRYNPGPFPLSESENQALVKFIENEKPTFILSLHSWHPMININGDCGAFAKKLNELTGYRIDESMGYPTPGCLGTYAALERGIPTLTYEIERGMSLDLVLKAHLPATLEALKTLEK